MGTSFPAVGFADAAWADTPTTTQSDSHVITRNLPVCLRSRKSSILPLCTGVVRRL